MKDLDLSGLKCPLPVLRTKKVLSGMKNGEVIRVTCTDPLAGIDIPNLVRETGDILEEQRQEGNAILFLIRKVS